MEPNVHRASVDYLELLTIPSINAYVKINIMKQVILYVRLVITLVTNVLLQILFA